MSNPQLTNGESFRSASESRNPGEDVGRPIEFHDSKGRLVFTVSPVGLDKMNPEAIEEWQLVLPMTSMGNEVGDLHISHRSDGVVKDYFVANLVSLHNGDQIILRNKNSNEREIFEVSIDPNTKAIELNIASSPSKSESHLPKLQADRL